MTDLIQEAEEALGRPLTLAERARIRVGSALIDRLDGVDRKVIDSWLNGEHLESGIALGELVEAIVEDVTNAALSDIAGPAALAYLDHLTEVAEAGRPHHDTACPPTTRQMCRFAAAFRQEVNRRG